MTIVDRTAGAALGLAVIATVIWGANAPMTIHGSDQAILRLAWSARPERVENCRQQTEEELARVPAHMRQPVVCEGVSAQYRLTVRREGRVVMEQLVHGGGLRQDRRIYVFHELPLDPGEGSIEVQFVRIDSDSARVTPAETHSEDRVPPHLVFAQRVRVRPREVILVTYSADQRALVGIQGSVQPSR